MKIIITEKQLTEVLGVDSAYLNINADNNGGMPTSNSDSEIFVSDKMDGKIPEPSTTDKIAKQKSPRSYFGATKRKSIVQCNIDKKKEELTESNKDLVNKKYTIPEHLFTILKGNLNNASNGIDGVKRLKNILSMRSLSTNEMYRIRNRFNNLSDNDSEYHLLGGDEMKRWIEGQLKTAKNISRTSKEVKRDMGFENPFIKSHTKDNGNGKAHTKKNSGVSFNYEN